MNNLMKIIKIILIVCCLQKRFQYYSNALNRYTDDKNHIDYKELHNRTNYMNGDNQDFNQCIQSSLLVDHFDFTANIPFAIVQSRDSQQQGDDFDLATSISRCYSKFHGGLSFQNIINTNRYPNLHFFTSRWKSIYERYWNTADWLIAADTDVVPIGFGNNIMNFLRHSKADVILHVRENAEVYSAVVIFRTRSFFSECFLTSWIQKGYRRQWNYDNGDLLQMVLDIINPQLAKKCQDIRDEVTNFRMYGAFVSCFSEIYEFLRYEYTTYEPNFIDYFPNPKIPLAIVPPRSGLVRSFEDPDTRYHPDCPLCTTFDEYSIFGHGYKSIGSYFVEDYLYNCSSYPPTILLPQCYRQNLFNQSIQLEVMKQCCLWHYPECHVEINGRVKNICREQLHCQESTFGQLGIGTCSC